MRIGSIPAYYLSVAQLALRKLDTPDNHHAHQLKIILKNDLIRKLNENRFGLTKFNYNVEDIKNNRMIFTQRF